MDDLLVRADVDLRSEASTHQFLLSALKRGWDMGNMTLVIFATQMYLLLFRRLSSISGYLGRVCYGCAV
eukprot:694823-Pleurochrysis_carterae.AAC.1